MPKFGRYVLALCMVLECGAASAHANCTLVRPTQMNKLPFAGHGGPEYGFAFDNEGLSDAPGQSSLLIATFDPATGAFSGLMDGPWAGVPGEDSAVTGIIAPTGDGNFTIGFSYAAPGSPFGADVTWAFTGVFHTVLLPATDTQACALQMQIAGIYTNTLPMDQRYIVYGPAPFSGAAMAVAGP